MDTGTTASTMRDGGSYIDASGVHTYYEVAGDGPPLVLLHAGMCTAETLDMLATVLSKQYRVYVPERVGHGRTADVDGPITYETMAQQTIAFMEAVGLDGAHLAGWSDGALVGLLVALRRPGLVRKLILIDQFVTLDGARAWYSGFISAMTVDSTPPGMAATYGAVSADGPDHFPIVFEKLQAIWTGDTGVQLDDLAHVKAPTLVLVGDDGCLTIEHAPRPSSARCPTRSWRSSRAPATACPWRSQRSSTSSSLISWPTSNLPRCSPSASEHVRLF